LKRLNAGNPPGGRRQSVDFRSGLPMGEVLWTANRFWWSGHGLEKEEAGWQGRAEEALDRLRALPDAGPDLLSTKGVEAVWQSLSS